MSVKLVWMTPNAMETIAFCARVSNPENQHNMTTAPQLINYLVKNKHFSPFEMAAACIEVVTTRDIARQILRHRSFSFQEFSQRYAVATEFVTREARLQDPKNRQNSIPLSNMDYLVDAWKEKQENLTELVEEIYQWALKNGIAKEQARVVLPEGMTLSKLYVFGTFRSWMHYVELRAAPGTQKEHMEIAEKCKSIFEEKGIKLWT